MDSVSFYSMSMTDLLIYCERNELPLSTARLLYNWHYKKNNRSRFDHQDLSKKAKSTIYSQLVFDLPTITEVYQSPDKTVKFLIQLKDQKYVETVLIPFQDKYTICLSSQVGCAMKCAFCYTGTQGLTRNLEVEEIVGQLLRAKEWLVENRPDDSRLLNIVFMGQGEPLHNFDAVKKACEIFLSQYGLSFAVHKITISTSGYRPGLERWKSEMPDVNIALSLHSLDTNKRSKIIPINAKYPIEEVLMLVESIPQGEKRFVTYEYLLLEGFNDSDEEAHQLGQFFKGKKAIMNLIPFNPFPGAEYGRPKPDRVEIFQKILASYDLPALIRTTKGDEILAACGQLNTKLTKIKMETV